MHCGDQRHLGLCLGYVPALAYGSCRVSDQGTTLRASDLHNARAAILNPFSKVGFSGLRSQGASLTFRELSKIFSWNWCIAKIVLHMRIASWNSVHVPKYKCSALNSHHKCDFRHRIFSRDYFGELQYSQSPSFNTHLPKQISGQFE